MSPRLTRGEYWLLAKAVEHNLPLWILKLPEGPPWNNNTIDEVMNCCGHGMGRPELERTLKRLVDQGWARLSRVFGNADECIPADRATFQFAFASKVELRQTVHVLLTPQGGAAWEQFARPSWADYISDEHDFGEDKVHQRCVVATDQARLKRYLQAVREEDEVEPGSEVYAETADWQPIYWKPPFAGVECRFRYRDREQPITTHYTHQASQRLRKHWCEWL